MRKNRSTDNLKKIVLLCLVIGIVYSRLKESEKIGIIDGGSTILNCRKKSNAQVAWYGTCTINTNWLRT